MKNNSISKQPGKKESNKKLVPPKEKKKLLKSKYTDEQIQNMWWNQ